MFAPLAALLLHSFSPPETPLSALSPVTFITVSVFTVISSTCAASIVIFLQALQEMLLKGSRGTNFIRKAPKLINLTSSTPHGVAVHADGALGRFMTRQLGNFAAIGNIWEDFLLSQKKL